MMRNAVSEVVGFLYIFGIVMTVLAIVFVQVNAMVEDVRKSILSQSLEKSFKRIQYVVHSVAFGDTPMQIAEIELQGGEMFLREGGPEFIIAFVNVSLNIDNCTPFSQVFKLECLNLSTGKLSDPQCNGTFDRLACVVNKTTGALEYRYKDWLLTMESGAVFSKYSSQDYSRMLYDPRLLLNTTAANNKYFMVTIPVMKSENGLFSISGSGRFRFLLNELGWEYARIENVNIGEGRTWENFTDMYLIVKGSENERAWCDFFDDFPLLNTTLRPENCKNSSNCNCYRAEVPMARLETEGFSTTIIILFKNVTLALV